MQYIYRSEIKEFIDVDHMSLIEVDNNPDVCVFRNPFSTLNGVVSVRNVRF